VKAAAAKEVAGKTTDEGCGSKWLHPTSQTSLPGCLETSVCPAFSPLSFFQWGFIL
jgi:hypothetical protein